MPKRAFSRTFEGILSVEEHLKTFYIWESFQMSSIKKVFEGILCINELLIGILFVVKLLKVFYNLKSF